MTPRTSTRSRIAALTLVALVATGCLSTRQVHEIEPPVDMPEGFGAEAAMDAPDESRWWLAIDDPALHSLIEDALDQNLELLQAYARIRQLEAVKTQNEAAWWPQLEGRLSAGRASNFSIFGNNQTNQYGISLNVAYEIDVWGRIAAINTAAQHDLIATRADMETMALAIAAQVAEAWYDLRYHRARRQLFESQITIREAFLEVITLRLNYGQGTRLDLLQQQQQIENLRGQLTLITSNEEAAQYRLAVLTGRPPGVVVETPPADLPELPPVPAVGVPADLLQRRPDLRSAQRRAAAADARVVVAIADRLPAVRLTGSISLQNITLTDLFDQLFWSVLASASGAIFDGGRRAAEVERTRAVYDERILAYGQRLLVALEEVEGALARERDQRLFVEALEQQRVLAEDTLDTAERRYQQGAGDYLGVLQSLEALQNIEQALLDSQRQQLRLRVQLYRALGGAWTQELRDPSSGDID